MNIVKKLMVGLVGLIVVLCVVSFVLPSKVHVERSALIHASRCTVYAQLDDFRNFNAWSPWAKRDPKTQYTFTGPSTGKGSKLSWESSHPEVGVGNQEITDAKPCESVVTALDFGAEGLATAGFTLTKEGTSTKVVWYLDSELDGIIARYFGLVFDSMIGPDYEAGLAGLKTITERMPKGDWEGLTFEEIEAKPQPMAYVTTAPVKGAEAIGKAFAEAYGKVGQFMAAKGVKSAGQPLSVTKSVTPAGDIVFDAGIPLESKPAPEASAADGDAAEPTAKTKEGATPSSPPAPADVHVGDTPGGKALKLVHKGPYKGIEGAMKGIDAYCAARGVAKGKAQWVQYISDPGNTKEADLITHIYQSIQ